MFLAPEGCLVLFALQRASEPVNNSEILSKRTHIGIMEIFGTCSVDS